MPTYPHRRRRVGPLLAFDHVSLPFMPTDNGQTVAERIGKDTLLIEDAAGSGGQPR